MECYAGIDDLKSTFVQFVNKVPFYGAVILCRDEPAVESIIPRIKRRVITYGFSQESDLRISRAVYSGFGSQFQLNYRGKSLGTFQLNIPGRHNVLNAVAAVGVGLDLGLAPRILQSALADFEGPDRRFQLKGLVRGLTLIDDYGHHPTEIVATLEAARHLQGNRLVVVFQPHRFTRTRYCFEAFAQAFDRADLVVLADIYAAGEEPINGLTSERLVRAIRQNGHREAHYLGAVEDMGSRLVPLLKTGDVVITMGAGSISKLAETLLTQLAASTEIN
jgi:UDP-N-acetylmuramate--alanine ligase